MKLLSMRCTNKFKQNGGVKVMVTFHSDDKHSIAMIAMDGKEAERFEKDKYYEFSAEAQKPR